MEDVPSKTLHHFNISKSIALVKFKKETRKGKVKIVAKEEKGHKGSLLQRQLKLSPCTYPSFPSPS